MKEPKEKIRAEATRLLDAGIEMMRLHSAKDKKIRKALNALDYQDWYTDALPLVRLLLADRIKEFQDVYKLEKHPAAMTVHNYRLADYLAGNTWTEDDNHAMALLLFQNQLAIFRSIANRLDSVIEDVTSELRREVFDSDIEAAKKLLKGNHLRAAGAVCGVVLEKHLAVVCKARGVLLQKKDPTIGEYAAALKTAQIVSLQMFKKIDTIGTLRNLCCHHKGSEPTVAEVQDLITGTIDVLNSVG